MSDILIQSAIIEDAPEILVLQRCCWVSEAIANDSLEIPPLHEDLEAVEQWVKTADVWTARRGGRLVGAVRAAEEDTAWQIGRIMVAPDLAGNGLGRRLLEHAEAHAPEHITRFELFTGRKSTRNILMYSRAGYTLLPDDASGIVYLTKAR